MLDIKAVPFVKQHDSMDCGVACLSMVCRYYGLAIAYCIIGWDFCVRKRAPEVKGAKDLRIKDEGPDVKGAKDQRIKDEGPEVKGAKDQRIKDEDAEGWALRAQQQSPGGIFSPLIL